MQSLNLFFKPIIRLVLFSFIIYFLHYFLNIKFLENNFNLKELHVFYFLINLILLVCFVIVAKNWTDKSGFLYMSFFLIKASIMVTYLLIFRNHTALTNSYILHFFAVYFAHLIFSIFNCVKVLHIFIKKA